MSQLARALMLALALAWAAPAGAAPVAWTNWNADLFAKAKAEKRFVILDLEAVWCHWCHVMEQTTYADAKVQGLIGDRYLPVRVDQDANPDLSSRYGDWGWPATIIFGPDGTEIAKVRGYVEPGRMASLLQAVIDDPTPGPSVGDTEAVVPAKSAFLTAPQRAELEKVFAESYDTEHGGWGGMLRYIDGDSMDWTLLRAGEGDADAKAKARQTLDAARALVDPVWGGVYQYSDKTDWSSPHFEKIMSYQAQYLRQYSEAYARWHDPRDLDTAKAIKDYLTSFLRGPDGAFYTSQDADLDHATTGHVYYKLDDAARRKLGLPRIDTHQYARENGWAITGLATYADATGDTVALDDAVKAAHWVQANRALEGGGFRHGETDRGGPFLGDTLAMGQAFLALYAATGDRDWLAASEKAAGFIEATFEEKSGGFLPAKAPEADAAVFAKTARQLDDQIQVARFMNLLERYTGKPAYRDAASHAMRYAVGAAEGMDRPLPGLLLADAELAKEPTHVTIVGHKDDPVARQLFTAARALPATYYRLEWWDTREGALTNPDVTYPELDKAAAFACSNRQCSLPTFTVGDLDEAVQRLARHGTGRQTRN